MGGPPAQLEQPNKLSPAYAVLPGVLNGARSHSVFICRSCGLKIDNAYRRIAKAVRHETGANLVTRQTEDGQVARPDRLCLGIARAAGCCSEREAVLGEAAGY
jgi:hypothetical protein